jgi:hypothetical protein
MAPGIPPLLSMAEEVMVDPVGPEPAEGLLSCGGP